MLLGSLIEKVDRLISDAEKANTGRGEIHEDLEKIRTRLHSMSNEVQIIKGDVAPLLAFKVKADRWEQRGIGALALIGMLASALGAVIGAQWHKLTQLFGYG